MHALAAKKRAVERHHGPGGNREPLVLSFVGETGVGKSFTIKILAEAVFSQARPWWNPWKAVAQHLIIALEPPPLQDTKIVYDRIVKHATNYPTSLIVVDDLHLATPATLMMLRSLIKIKAGSDGVDLSGVVLVFAMNHAPTEHVLRDALWDHMELHQVPGDVAVTRINQADWQRRALAALKKSVKPAVEFVLSHQVVAFWPLDESVRGAACNHWSCVGVGTTVTVHELTEAVFVCSVVALVAWLLGCVWQCLVCIAHKALRATTQRMQQTKEVAKLRVSESVHTQIAECVPKHIGQHSEFSIA